MVSSQAEAVSRRRRLANAAQIGNRKPGRLVLPAGPYHWSVHAVGSAVSRGPFGSEAIFNVTSPEAGVHTLTATSLQSSSAVLNGEVDPRGLPATAWFEWGKTTSYDQSTVPQIVNGAGWKAVQQSVSALDVG